MIAERDETQIRKLRINSNDSDALSLRLRFARALAAADLKPASLPRSAIACIRKLRDPLPGALRLEGGNLQTPLVWERAVADSLEQLVRRAARPALGHVPVNVEAVVFLDRSELIACLASDWLEGAAASRWWWRSIFETADIARALVRAWIEAPEHAPAALGLLARSGKAAAFVCSLGVGDSRLLLGGITRRFALHDLAAGLEVVLNESSGATGEEIAATHQQAQRQPDVRSSTPSESPWRRWVKETEDGELQPAQRHLLVVGLMLVRAPTIVRSRSFAEALVQWNRTEIASARSAETNQGSAVVGKPRATAAKRENLGIVSSSDGVEHESSHRSDEEVALATAAAPARRFPSTSRVKPVNAIVDQSCEISSRQNPETEAKLEPLLSAARAKPEQPLSNAPLLRMERAYPSEETLLANPATGQSPQSSVQREPERSRVNSRMIQLPNQSLESDLVVEAEIETQLGGFFYLINLGLFLNLYGDFTTPAQPGIELPIWDFIALAGKHLSAGKIEAPGSAGVSPACDVVMTVSERQARRLRSQADPIWSLLALLSGRKDDDPPGEEFFAPDSWRLPLDWLATFPEECVWRWEVSQSRLRVHHPAKFLVVDVPVEDDAGRQVLRETRDYPAIAGLEYCSVSLPVEEAKGSKLERWIAWLLPYVRSRMVRALGLADPNDLQRLVFEHHARVSVTATHLDVSFSLDEHPLEIRLAGLDRNPGWVPAAGRYIAFHFD